ncbi:C-terminal binding protein [Lactonifactor longoviformis]|uniref:C-terminal binding protein n=1 Tax=Lactonifactor longoviformis TaxID=341220 RepID=UPI001D02BC10|nr:C-terminal binding protein [Lactonifactor longoviformis]MCB5713528.1 C-terminal binding protein [Lactonifactor longoviformis]MCB5717627.1 C-terminal binding protein [Lactonifactor longoviformis]
MIQVYYTSKHTDGIEYIRETLTDQYQLNVRPVHVGNDEDMLIDQCRDADVVICDFEPFTKRVLEALPKLKLLQFTGVGFNEVDLEAATNLGIAVCNTPQYCKNEVADHAVALMLAINRRLLMFHKMIQEEETWSAVADPSMKPMRELTVGLAGFGNIPKEVAKRLQAFGTRVITFDPYVPEEVSRSFDVEKVELDEFLRQADYISCHLPVTPDTVSFFRKEIFDQCKDGVVFINTSRGAVVNEADLADALDRGKVSYAGLDVLNDEHPDLHTHVLAHRENVIITPHAAFYSASARKNGRIEAAQSIMSYMEGRYAQAPVRNGVRGRK